MNERTTVDSNSVPLQDYNRVGILRVNASSHELQSQTSHSIHSKTYNVRSAIKINSLQTCNVRIVIKSIQFKLIIYGALLKCEKLRGQIIKKKNSQHTRYFLDIILKN